MQNTEDEIAEKIRESIDRSETVAVLALSNKVDKTIIRQIAVDHKVLLPWSEAKCRELYDKGYSDGQIREEFGFGVNVIRAWRQQAGLEPNKNRIKFSGGKVRIDNEKARALYDAGKTDKQIADELGVSAGGVLGWRHRNKLPSKYGTKLVAAHPAELPPATPAPTALPVSSVPALPASTCECCGADLQVRSGIELFNTAVIGGREYRVCGKCAGIVGWVSRMQHVEAVANE